MKGIGRAVVLVLVVFLGLALVPEIAKLGPVGIGGAVVAWLAVLMLVFVFKPPRRQWGTLSHESVQFWTKRKREK